MFTLQIEPKPDQDTWWDFLHQRMVDGNLFRAPDVAQYNETNLAFQHLFNDAQDYDIERVHEVKVVSDVHYERLLTTFLVSWYVGPIGGTGYANSRGMTVSVDTDGYAAEHMDVLKRCKRMFDAKYGSGLP